MKNTRKRQMGAGLKVPILDDIYSKVFAYNFTTKLDKQLGRLDIYSKMFNMKELVSWIYLGKGDILNAAIKSNTSIITQIGKRLVTNRYTVPGWFDKNFITKDQIIDCYESKIFWYCNILTKYLKQLFILITGSKEGFPERAEDAKVYGCNVSELPDLGPPSETFRSKLAQIFGEDVMDRFIKNYIDVKNTYKQTRSRDYLSGTSDSAAGNPLDNVAGNTHAFHADNVAGNDNAWDPDNPAYDAHYAEIAAKRGIRGGTRRRRRNKSNKRRKTRK